MGLRDRLRAALALDGEADPQARDDEFDPWGTTVDVNRATPDRGDISDWVDEYKENPLIRVPTQVFVADILEPGVRVELGIGEDDTPPTVSGAADTQFNGLDLDDALEKWLSQAGIVNGEFDHDLVDVLEQALKDEVGRRGTAMVEIVYDDAEQQERIMGLRPFRVETVTAYTREGTSILLQPDDTVEDANLDHGGVFGGTTISSGSRSEIPQTDAGGTACYVQFDDVFLSRDEDEVRFAQDDVVKLTNDADTADIFGTPYTASVYDRAHALRQQFKDLDQALSVTAYSHWVAQVETNDRDEAEQLLDSFDPSNPERVNVVNYQVEATQFEGDVPSVEATIKQQIDYVLSAFPVPIYRIGFEGDINRDVTSEQSDDYQRELSDRRDDLATKFGAVLQRKAAEWVDDPPAVELEIAPRESENPLHDEAFDAGEFSSVMSGIKAMSSKSQPPTEILPKETVVETFLGLDADGVFGDDGEAAMEALDEADSRVREQFADAYLKDGDDFFRDVPVLPTGIETLSDAWVRRWAEWIAAGRPDISLSGRLAKTAELDWNPALHPRDPETGKFVERPFNLPDDAPDFGDMSTKETLSYIKKNGGDIAGTVFDSDSSVTVDGIPDDASSLDDIGDGDADTPDTDGGTVKSTTDLDSFEELSPGDQIKWEDGSTTGEIEEIAKTEDGQTVAFTDDGFYTEDVALPDDSSRNLTPEAQTLEDDLGVKTANLSGLDEEERQEVVSILRDEFDNDLRKHFGTAGSVTTTPPSDIEDGEAAAAYQGSTRTLYINPNSFSDTPSDRELNVGGVALGPTDRKRMIQHELSHTQHFMKGAEEYGNIRDRGLTDAERDLAAEEVSSYAAYNPHEFVAEVATGLKNNVDFDGEVLDLYEELNGPEVNT